MIRITLLALALPLVVAEVPNYTFRCNPCHRKSFPANEAICEISQSFFSKPITIDHEAIQDTTCGDIWAGVNAFLFNPEECGAIQEKTLSTLDPCGCVATKTQASCEPPPATNRQSCDICVGKGNAVGDPNKIVQGGMWEGNPCSDLFSLQDQFDFSESQCAQAQDAAAAHCQCHDSTKYTEVNAVIQCHAQEDGDDPCYKDDPDSICCIGECKFRWSQGENVCTTKPAEDPGDYQIPSEVGNTGIPNFTWGDLSAPEGTCGNGGDSCVEEADCCASMKCVQGNLGPVCAGGGGINKPSAAAGGGAGGGGRGGAGGNARKRRNLKKTSRPNLKKGGLRRIQI